MLRGGYYAVSVRDGKLLDDQAGEKFPHGTGKIVTNLTIRILLIVWPRLGGKSEADKEEVRE